MTLASFLSRAVVAIGLVLLAGVSGLEASAFGAAAEEGVGPASIDLRPAFRDMGLALRLQGRRGTCSVFTMAGAMEYALAHRQRRGIALSVEFLNWASNDATRTAHDGGFFSDLWAGFVKHGVCPEADMPYQPRFDAKQRPSEAAMERARAVRQAGLRLHWIKSWDVKTGLTEAQMTQIKNVLARQWPVCGGFRWPKREQWNEGVLQMAPPEGVFDGHSVLLVGYRDDPQRPGGGVFFIRNSGREAPELALPYAYVQAYMNDALWIDHSPTPSTRPGALGHSPGQ